MQYYSKTSQEVQNAESCPYCVKGAVKLHVTECFRRAGMEQTKILPSHCLVAQKRYLGISVRTYMLNIDTLIEKTAESYTTGNVTRTSLEINTAF